MPPVDAILRDLRSLLANCRSVVVAYSGGVDSAVTLRAALDALPRESVLAITGRSPSVPAQEIADAARLAAEIGATHEFLETREFDDPRYLANPANRCYFCKTELYDRLQALAADRGFATVVNGVNADDQGDWRPGIQAGSERAVRSPLAELGLTKADVRRVAAALGLEIHDKPASPCLSSRVQYGETITPEKLARIDAAERILRNLGFRECRVRHHDQLARIEVPPAEIARLADDTVRTSVERAFRQLGYQYVTLDLRGFRSGSLNEVLLGNGLAGRVP